MSASGFSHTTTPPSPRELPEILPVFPLTGVLLLPGTVLPLHVFEPRYRNLVGDALATDGVFGMIQPVVPRPDNRPGPGCEHEAPELYGVGCAGWMGDWKEMEDGRYVLQLRGLNRFRVIEELPPHRGYRRVHAAYDAFPEGLAGEGAGPADRERGWRGDRRALIQALEHYGQVHGLRLPLAELDSIDDLDLVNALGIALPFRPEEKQALLEARTPSDREAVLLGLLRMGELPPCGDPSPTPVN